MPSKITVNISKRYSTEITYDQFISGLIAAGVRIPADIKRFNFSIKKEMWDGIRISNEALVCKDYSQIPDRIMFNWEESERSEL